MPVFTYKSKQFKAGGLDIIAKANDIITIYRNQGFRLTLRQIYYQFIAKDLFPEDWVDAAYNVAQGLDPSTKNTIKNYKRLASILNDARLSGLVDWSAIEDRTRETSIPVRWDSPSVRLKAAANAYRIDKWKSQLNRVEVWVEKEALAGVFEPICTELDLPLLCCRGYTSQSEMWESAMRMTHHIISEEQKVVILHFGDHDPSGMDMSRDIENRLRMFIGGHVEHDADEDDNLPFEFVRCALSIAQVRQYDAPPNPAKKTDARFKQYRKKYGDESWELDALEPTVLAQLVRDNVFKYVRGDAWRSKVRQEDKERAQMAWVAENWSKVVKKPKK